MAPVRHGPFYPRSGGKEQLVSFTPGPPPAFGKPAVLFDARGHESVYALGPDGKRLLMMPLIASEHAGTQVRVVFNLLTELRQRVGACS